MLQMSITQFIIYCINRKMYSDRFFSSQSTKIVLTVLTVILLTSTLVNLALAGLYAYQSTISGAQTYAHLASYFAILGVFQIVINVQYIMQLYQCLSITRSSLLITIFYTIIELAMAFAAAVWNSTNYRLYSSSTDSIINVIYHLTLAQSLVNYLVIVPIVLVKFLLMLDANMYLSEMKRPENTLENIKHGDHNSFN